MRLIIIAARTSTAAAKRPSQKKKKKKIIVLRIRVTNEELNRGLRARHIQGQKEQQEED